MGGWGESVWGGGGGGGGRGLGWSCVAYRGSDGKKGSRGVHRVVLTMKEGGGFIIGGGGLWGRIPFFSENRVEGFSMGRAGTRLDNGGAIL